MRGHGTQAGRAARSGILSALSLALLALASIAPTGRLGLVAAAGLMPAAAVVSGGLPLGFLCWAASGLLGLILLPDKGNALLYLAFFGIYPMVKSAVERLRKLPLEWLCKLAFFNGVLTVFWLVLRSMLLAALPSQLRQPWLAYLAGNIVFILYDYGFSKLMMFYAARIDRIIRRG